MSMRHRSAHPTGICSVLCVVDDVVAEECVLGRYAVFGHIFEHLFEEDSAVSLESRKRRGQIATGKLWKGCLEIGVNLRVLPKCVVGRSE